MPLLGTRESHLMNGPLAIELLKRYDSKRAERDSVNMSDWQKIGQYFLPQESDIQVSKTEGVTDWTDQIYDTTAIECAETLKTGQYNWLTPPQQPWIEFTVPDELDGKDTGDATAWLGNCSSISLRELARSNFYSMASLSYLGCGTFGTDFLLLEEGKKTSFNFRHAKIGTYVIEENSEGVVDTTMREFTFTFRQACQEFGEDNLPKKLADQAKGADGLKKKFKFLHCIFPREDSDRLPNRKDGANKPIASVYIAIDFKECVKVSGFDEQPAMVRRFDKWGTGSPWGYSPSYLGLPIARQLNYVQQYMDALAELHAYPRVLIPDNLEGDVDLRAGGATTWDTSNPTGKPEEWMTVGEYKLGLEMQEQRREQLRDAFKTKAFKLLNSSPLIDKKMTAFEISQHQAEQIGDITPSLGRAIPEFFNVLGMRIFSMLYRSGKFGQAPQSLMQDLGGGKTGLVMPQVQISNRLTDALRALKNRSREETMQFLMPQVEAGKPEVLDILADSFNRNYVLDSGVPSDELRPEKGANSVEAIRQQRAQMMAAQRQAALTEQMAGAAGKLGKAPGFAQDAVKDMMSPNGKAA